MKYNLVEQIYCTFSAGSHGLSVHSNALNDQPTSYHIASNYGPGVYFFPTILTQPLNDWDSLVEDLCVIYNICDARSEL